MNRTHLWSALNWLFWAVVFGLAPLWLMAILLKVLRDDGSVMDLVSNGEFALYAASMSGTAIYLTSIDRMPAGMRWRTRINAVAGIALLVAAFSYGAVQTLGRLGTRFGVEVPLDVPVLTLVTFTAYVAATIVAFLATLADAVRLDEAYQERRKSQTDDLAERFRGGGGGNG